ncbi:MAG: TetR family transcriptional regulator [Burkholderiales bacterium]|nr:TetR family transcriptional regulator [Burkholderiales bacterium]
MPPVDREPTRGSPDTKERILAAAEALFMEQGYAATSLRAITAQANVNLAAVNYHFGSKEALIREVFDRRLGPLNQARLDYLARVEFEAGGRPLTPEKILEAMITPVVQLSRDPLKRGAVFLRLLGRALSEPADTMKQVLPIHYRDVVLRFKEALVRALPDVPEQELVWRMHFTFGAMAYAMAGNDALQLITTCEVEGADDAEAIIRRLVPFLAAGLKAPVPLPMRTSTAHPTTNREAA